MVWEDYTIVKIQDTGKRRVSDTSANEYDVVNAFNQNGTPKTPPTEGNEIILKGVSVKTEVGVSDNKSPVLSKLRTVSGDDATKAQKRQFEFCEVDDICLESPKYSLTGVLDFSEAEDRKLCGRLMRLVKTKTVKKFICGVARFSQYDELQQAEVAEESRMLDWIYVRVGNISFDHASNSKHIKYSLELYETG